MVNKIQGNIRKNKWDVKINKLDAGATNLENRIM